MPDLSLLEGAGILAAGKPFRLLVTGSRDWPDPARIHGALNGVLDGLLGQPLVIVHGDCPAGADAAARRWVYVKLGATCAPVSEERHPAQWGKLGKRAGPVRNAQMVEAGADMCFAWIMPCAQAPCRNPEPHGSHGASGCADQAEAAGIQVRRFFP